MDLDYKAQHHRYLRLREALTEVPGVFSELSYLAQWELFGYYLPHERMGPASLALHQLQMNQRYPELGRRVEQHLALLYPVMKRWARAAKPRTEADKYLVALGREETWRPAPREKAPDFDRLSEALLARATALVNERDGWWRL